MSERIDRNSDESSEPVKDSEKTLHVPAIGEEVLQVAEHNGGEEGLVICDCGKPITMIRNEYWAAVGTGEVCADNHWHKPSAFTSAGSAPEGVNCQRERANLANALIDIAVILDLTSGAYPTTGSELMLLAEDIKSLVAKPSDARGKLTKGIACPFCGEDDFDKIGLKQHLQAYCEVYLITDTVHISHRSKGRKE